MGVEASELEASELETTGSSGKWVKKQVGVESSACKAK